MCPAETSNANISGKRILLCIFLLLLLLVAEGVLLRQRVEQRCSFSFEGQQFTLSERDGQFITFLDEAGNPLEFKNFAYADAVSSAFRYSVIVYQGKEIIYDATNLGETEEITFTLSDGSTYSEKWYLTPAEAGERPSEVSLAYLVGQTCQNLPSIENMIGAVFFALLFSGIGVFCLGYPEGSWRWLHRLTHSDKSPSSRSLYLLRGMGAGLVLLGIISIFFFL